MFHDFSQGIVCVMAGSSPEYTLLSNVTMVTLSDIINTFCSPKLAFMFLCAHLIIGGYMLALFLGISILL